MIGGGVHYALSNEPNMNIVRCPEALPPKKLNQKRKVFKS